MKTYCYIPFAKNVVWLLLVAFAAGGVNGFAYDYTHQAKADPGKEKRFEVFLNNSALPHQTTFERQSNDNEYREGSHLFITSLFQDFINEGFRFSAPKISWGTHFNKIQFSGSPLFLIHCVIQV